MVIHPKIRQLKWISWCIIILFLFFHEQLFSQQSDIKITLNINNRKLSDILDSLSNTQGNSSGTTSINDLKWGLNLDITATQLIFSGEYLIGIQYSKAYRNLSEIAITKSESDLKFNVANAYYLVLIAQENIKVLDSTYQNTNKLLTEIEAINKAGLIEETDVDQLRITVNTISNALDMLKRQNEMAKNLLKLQIGMYIYDDIELSDDLNSLIDKKKPLHFWCKSMM